MLRLAMRCVLVLMALWLLPVLLIRAQPYHDRASALVQENCAMPCFLRVRPGATTMSEAVAIVGGHEWVANGPFGFPAHVRDAALFQAIIPRTLIQLRWTDALPEWIDEAHNGILLVEDQRVLSLMIDTRLSLGEVLIALGDPDQSWYSSPGRQQFAYSAWYAGKSLFITTQGQCPTWRYYDFPVRVAFRPDVPVVYESVPRQAVC